MFDRAVQHGGDGVRSRESAGDLGRGSAQRQGQLVGCVREIPWADSGELLVV